MFASQSDWLKDEAGNVRVPHILRFESLNDDYQKLASQLGIEATLPHLNATTKKNKNYYDEETAEIIRKWFQEDLERFGYTFEDYLVKINN
jgi:hypothetical protein